MNPIDERKTRLCQWGTSRGIRIPKGMCETVGIELGSSLDMSVGEDAQGTYILLRPEISTHRSFNNAPYISMDEVFAGYKSNYVPSEFDWGEDVGSEVIE